ncbi:hypothetical protein DLM78_23530 [Leptospira stimsonii]|uniref:Uncharacterized protein n=1 Tax=Leptospira stimsonii TaxID=2202203 RepID=A0A8B3CIE3_9LEPT|nr:hypothetical protein DLM78_23530 [Leptospira stimsonii]
MIPVTCNVKSEPWKDESCFLRWRNSPPDLKQIREDLVEISEMKTEFENLLNLELESKKVSKVEPMWNFRALLSKKRVAEFFRSSETFLNISSC